MKIRVCMLYGSELCAIYERLGLEEVLEEVQVFEFDTQKEADAFLLGVESATGYLESLVIDNNDYDSLTKTLK